MVSAIRRILHKQINGMHQAAYIMGIFAIASLLLGFLRDRLFASTFGAGLQLDIYYASFRIPDLIFVVLSSVVSASVLVPLLIHKQQDTKENIATFITSLASAFFLVAVIIAALIAWQMPFLLSVVFADLVMSEFGEELITMSRIMLLSPILLGFSNLVGSILQSNKRFVSYAISPVFYNLGIIIGLVLLYPIYGMYGLAWGVVLGALLHIAIQLPSLFMGSQQFSVARYASINWREVWEVARNSIPRTIALASNQITLLVCLAVASTLVAGSVSVFTLSYNLQSVPMSLVGVSYSLAAFPVLAGMFSRGDVTGYVSHLATAARHIIFWSIPIAVAFIVLRAQIVRVVLGGGEFSWTDTRLTAACLAFFAVSVVAQSLSLLFTRGLYSVGSTRVPLYANTASAVLSIGFVFLALWAMEASSVFRGSLEGVLRIESLPGTEIVAIAAALSFGLIVNALILWIVFEHKYRGFTTLFSQTIRDSILASAAFGVVAYLSLYPFSSIFDTTTFIGIFLQGASAGVVGALAWVVVLRVLSNEEFDDAALALKQTRAKITPPIVDQTVDEHVVS